MCVDDIIVQGARLIGTVAVGGLKINVGKFPRRKSEGLEGAAGRTEAAGFMEIFGAVLKIDLLRGRVNGGTHHVGLPRKNK